VLLESQQPSILFTSSSAACRATAFLSPGVPDLSRILLLFPTLVAPATVSAPYQDLPYGTMGDSEMRKLDIGTLQDDGVIFVWVTGSCSAYKSPNCAIPTLVCCTT